MSVGEEKPRSRSPRRAPRAEDRGRAAEQTREKILQAAVVEFGAKGYSGARTAGIADRAGVNQQLITYYFGGKQGVLDELRRQWSSRQRALVPPDASFEQALRAYLDGTLDEPDWARLVIWRALGDNPSQSNDADLAQRERVRQGVERIRKRQLDGELTTAVTAEFVVLLSHLVAFAPIAMPQLVRDIFGVDPTSPDYRRACADQLLILLAVDPERTPRHRT